MGEKTAVNPAALSALSAKFTLGTWETVSLPYTPTADGFLYVYLNPSSSTGAYFRLSYSVDSQNIFIGQNAKSGDGVSLFAPVKKGAQITQAALTGGTIAVKFMSAFGA